MPAFPRSASRRLAAGGAVAAVIILTGCAGETTYDRLEAAKPTGSAFSMALFRDYRDLARSFGIAQAPANGAFDAEESYSLSGVSPEVSDVAEAYAAKALVAGKGEEPLPEPSPTDNTLAEQGRQKLLRALDQGRTKSPELAARTQADYDCWVVNAPVDELRGAARHCQDAFNADLARLTGTPSTVTAAPIAPVETVQPQQAAQAPVPQSAEFTVYFALDSALLDPAAQGVLQQAIATARAGRQTHITVVGHTDTVGSEAFNQGLSDRRADAVKTALVSMGARGEAIEASGDGERNLAVATPDGVENPKNRRAVITLVP
jgi:OOP family OmpA-OmpF porin